ncbi:DHH family phosphoesterase [Lachnospiraceae bacterium ZAX-1]
MKRKIKLKGQLRNYMYWPLFMTILLVISNVPAYYLNTYAGILLSITTVIYFIIVLLAYLYNKPVILNELINFATQYGTVQKKLIYDLEIPYALLDFKGKILWSNKAFSQATGKGNEYHRSVTSIFPDITREVIEAEGEGITINIVYENRYYRASMSKLYFDAVTEESDVLDLSDNEQFLTVLYLFDETELNEYIIKNQQERMLVSLIYIDNYEEALQSIEEVKRSLLVALVDRKVNNYFTERDGLVKKLEKDKYFLIFKYKYLEELMADKFNLIEEVKTIKVGNEMAVTLSIGIGAGGASYQQKYASARMAIDLALGRGGDQVVIKEGEKISYFGGKSKQLAKATRVKARVKAHALREIIESKESVVIMGHSIGDVDSFGASIGIYCATSVLGKRAYIVLNEVTSSLRPLKECFTPEKHYPPDMFITNERALELVGNNTVLMVVDTNRPNYTECPELLKRTKTIVVFDHHRQGSEGIEHAVLSYIETYASSTCEMVAEVLQYFSENIHLEPNEADCIYAGILIDTTNFMSRTGVRTFEAAAYLRGCGAEVTRVRKLLRDDMSAYKARAEAVRYAEVFRGSFAISVCPGDNVESPTIAGAQAANELLNIVGIKASFVFTKYNGKIFISSRSIDEINVQLIMERLGGGGHLNVAGAQLVDCTMEEAKQKLQKTLDTMIEEGDLKN